jgi:hypothetical protein
LTQGFVHIVESPSALDLLDGRTEGRALSEALRLAGIAHCYSLASNGEMLIEALSNRLRLAIDTFKAPPILHFSGHGNSTGIGLTSGEFLSWDDLDTLLRPIHKAFDGGLLICLSSCESSSGMQMAMMDGDERPFWALVSHMGKPTWADCAIGYIAFYHRFFKDHGIEASVEAMKAATGDDRFAAWSGEEIKTNWLNRAQSALQTGLSDPTSPQGRGLGALGIASLPRQSDPSDAGLGYIDYTPPSPRPDGQ